MIRCQQLGSRLSLLEFIEFAPSAEQSAKKKNDEYEQTVDFQYDFDFRMAPNWWSMSIRCKSDGGETERKRENEWVYYALVPLLLRINTYYAIRVLAKPEQRIITDSMAAFRLRERLFATVRCTTYNGLRFNKHVCCACDFRKWILFYIRCKYERVLNAFDAQQRTPTQTEYVQPKLKL